MIAPGGPATRRPVPAPNTAPTVSARELLGAAVMRAMNVAAANNVFPARVPTEKRGASVVDRNRFDITFPSCSLRLGAEFKYKPRKSKIQAHDCGISTELKPSRTLSMALLPSRHNRAGDGPIG